MKNLKNLGFAFNDEINMYSVRSIEQLNAIMGEKIYFTYSDSDNGSISGIGVINNIEPLDIDNEGEGHYSVNFTSEHGDSLHRIKYAKDCIFSDGSIFRGGIYAGDDMDLLLIRPYHV